MHKDKKQFSRIAIFMWWFIYNDVKEFVSVVEPTALLVYYLLLGYLRLYGLTSPWLMWHHSRCDVNKCYWICQWGYEGWPIYRLIYDCSVCPVESSYRLISPSPIFFLRFDLIYFFSSRFLTLLHMWLDWILLVDCVNVIIFIFFLGFMLTTYLNMCVNAFLLWCLILNSDFFPLNSILSLFPIESSRSLYIWFSLLSFIEVI